MEDKYAAQPEQEIAPKTPDADDVDALLQDVKSLLGESDGETAELPPPEDEPVPEDPGSEPLNAEDVHIDYGKFYGPEEQQEPEAPLTYYEQSKPAYQRARRAEYERAREQERRNNKVVNIHTTTQLQVVLVKPERFENASEIADHLRDKRTVVLNLEKTDKNIARRLIDFLSGVAYANEGTIKKVALSTYIITPYNVEILGDLIDELENNGLYF